MVRAPVILRVLGPAIQRLPVRSRLRRVLVRRRISQVYEAFSRGDMRAFLVLGCHPTVEFHTATDEVGVPFGVDLADVYRGRDGVAAFARNWGAAWEDYRIEAEEVIDCGDKLVVCLRHTGRGKGSGVELDQPLAQVLHLRGGQAVRIDTFWEQLKALEALGLESTAASREGVIRKPLSVRERSRRAPLEWLALRVPWCFDFGSRLLFRLPPMSGIRQALVWRGNQLAYEAFNRGDFEAFVITFHPDAEFHNPRELVELGIGESCCRGPSEYVRLLKAWSSAWGELRVSPRELTDFGERQLMLGEIEGRGAGSGIAVSQPFAALNTYKDGKLVLHQGWFDHVPALKAAGLQE